MPLAVHPLAVHIRSGGSAYAHRPPPIPGHLEQHTKVLGRPILIDERTREGLDPAIPVEDHGTVQLKSRSQPVRVFSVVPSS